MNLEHNPMLVIEFLEVIKESSVECKDKSDTYCVCIEDIKLDSLLYVINSAEEIIRKWASHERPQGEWVTHRVAFHLTCPFCGCNIRALKDKVFEGDYDYNFCPNCGADMRGNKNDNPN